MQQQPVVGRAAQLGELDAWLASVSAGSRAVLIEGEAGIGKTTLWRHAVDAARSKEYTVLLARPAQIEARSSFSVLGDLVGAVEVDSLGLPRPQAAALEFALGRSELAGGRGADRRLIALGFEGLLHTMSRRGSVVIAIDDVQWMDPPSSWVLRFALRRVSIDTRVGLVATHRAETPLPLGEHLEDEAGIEVTRLALGPMSLGAVDQIVRGQFGQTLARPALIEVHRLSRGNPLFALELARAVLDGREHDRAHVRVSLPDTLAAAMRARLGRRRGTDADVLLAVAVLSEPTVRVLVRAFGRDAEAFVDRYVEEGVLEPSPSALRFTHPLLSSVVQADASLGQLRDVHRRLATAVDGPEERVRHLALSQHDADAMVADELEVAARHAQAGGAPESAVELIEHSLRLTPDFDHDKVLRRRIAAASCHLELGDSGRAVEVLESVVCAAQPGPIRAEALRWLGEIHGMALRFRDALAVLTEALVLPDIGEQLSAEIELDIAFASVGLGDLGSAAAHADVAAQLAAGLGDDGLIAETMSASAFIAFLMGAGADRGRMARALELEDVGRQRPLVLRPSLLCGLVLWWCGENDEARRTLETIRSRLVERGQDASLPGVLYLLIRLELARGGVAAALRYLDESGDASAQDADDVARLIHLQAQADVDLHLGRLDHARAIAEEIAPRIAEAGWLSAMVLQLATLATVSLLEGRAAEVDARVGHVVAMLAALGLPDPSQAPFLADEVEALIALGEFERADELLTLADSRARALARASTHAMVARGRASLLAERGEVDRGLRAFDAAISAASGLPDAMELGRTLLAKGEAARRAKRWSTARSALDEATDVFERLGAAAWAARARRERARVGGRGSAPPSELSPTERAIASLVARGRTNREAAQTLHLSTKSVEANLTRIYRKLTVRSRVELAARWADLEHT